MVPMVTASELDELGATRGGPRHAQRAHSRLGPRIHEPNTLEGGHQGADSHPELHLERGRRTEAGPSLGGCGERSDETGRGVTVNERAPGHHVVDVGTPVNVLDA